jgi:hypothetical protein
MRFFIVPVFFVFILTSCSDLNKKEQLSQIENMNKTLDSVQTVLIENQIDTLPALIVATMTVELRIKNNYYADTIDMALGKKMDAFKILRRKLDPLGRTYNTVNLGVKEQKESLRLLHTDIENGSGERKKFDEYVTFEADKVDKLRKLLNEYVSEKGKTMNEMDRLYPEMNAFSLSLLNKKQTK